MTIHNAELLSPKARALAEKCISTFSELEANVDFLQNIERLVCRSYVRHIVSNTSFIRQMHVIAFPGKDRQIAQIYLLIDDGRVHGLKLTGFSHCLGQMVDELGSLVREDDGSVSVEHKKARLAALIKQKSHHDLTVWTFEREEYAPSSGFLKSARRSIIVSLRDFIQVELTREKSKQIQAIVTEFFPYFSARAGSLDSFFNQLDREIIDQINELERVSKLSVKRDGLKVRFTQLSTYNFFAAGDPIRRRNRLQALSEFPWIAPYVIPQWRGVSKYPETTKFDTISWNDKLEKWGQPLREAIDLGRPLITEAAKIFCVPKETIRWSMQRNIVFFRPFSYERIDDLLRLLSYIPSKKRPVNDEEWRLLQSSLFYLMRIFECCVERGRGEGTSLMWRNDNAKLIVMPAMQKILKHRFQEIVKMRFSGSKSAEMLCQYLPRVLLFFKIDQWLCRNLADVCDFLETLGKAWQARCAGFHNHSAVQVVDSSAFLNAWQAQLTLREIAAISTKWHSELHVALNQGFASSDEDGIQNEEVLEEWPPVLDKPFVFGSLHIVQLMNGGQLIKEGGAMRHCIGSYYEYCLNGRSQIFSLRTKNNEHLSTLELQLDAQTGGNTVSGSHSGFKNSPPNDLCKRAAAALIDFLNSSQRAKCLTDLMQVKAVNHEQYSDVKIETIQYQEFERANYDNVAEEIAWRCAFPSEKNAQSFVEKFRIDNQGSVSPASFGDDNVALSKLLG